MSRFLSLLAIRLASLASWRRYFVACLAGALAVLAHPPFDLAPIYFLSFPVLVWLLDGAIRDDPRLSGVKRMMPAFWTGWWFGFGYFLAGLWWVGRAVMLEAAEYWWALPLTTIVLPAGLAMFHGAACGLARAFWSHGIGRIASLAFFLALAEWLRSFVMTGFPWNSIGQGVMPIPLLMQSSALLGPFAMTALAVLVVSLPALLGGVVHRRLALVLALLLIGGHTGFGAWRLQLAGTGDAPGVVVRIVQPSIDQSEKWDRARAAEIFQTFLTMSSRPPEGASLTPDLIIWPETSIPFLLQTSSDALEAIGRNLQPDQMLLAGGIRREGEDEAARYYNSIFVVDPDGRIVDSSDKVKLVPFGEFLPLSDILSVFGLSHIVSAPGAFSPGEPATPLELGVIEGLIGLICYEVIFPQLVQGLAQNASAFINITNDGWYGNTPGPYQHLRQARIRAVELGIPVIRAANSGVSAIVDGYGRIQGLLKLNAIGNLDGAIPPVLAPTFYRRHGNLGFWAIMIALAGVSLGMRRRPRP